MCSFNPPFLFSCFLKVELSYRVHHLTQVINKLFLADRLRLLYRVKIFHLALAFNNQTGIMSHLKFLLVFVMDLLWQHIKSMIDDNCIIVESYVDDMYLSCYDCNSRRISIPKVNDKLSYFICLHEIAHCLLNHCEPNFWDNEVRMEIEANTLMYKLSIIKSSKKIRDTFEKNRIKGSFE